MPRLADDHGGATLDDLRHWLRRPVGPANGPRHFPLARRDRLAVPHAPGVYRFRRSNGDILYVGKAADLHRRVNRYFQTRSGGSRQTLEMLVQAARVTVTATPSALEAALLENGEIKRLQPPYNRLLKMGGRRLVYVSRDLAAAGPEPSPEWSLGPLPDSRALGVAGRLLAHLASCRPSDSDWLATACGADVPWERGTAPELLWAGMEAFRGEHAAALQRHAGHDLALRVGGRIWWRRMGAACALADRTDTGDPPGENDAATAAAREWTPGDARAWIEGCLSTVALHLRRACWFRLLMNAAVVWQGPAGHCHALILRGGEVVAACRGVPPDAPPPAICAPAPVPTGGMSVTTYDRLRVLTTELRRLSARGRRVIFWRRGGSGRSVRRVSAYLRWV